MSTETASSIIRAALSSDINTSVDSLVEKVKEAGIKVTPQSVKNLTYNLRSVLKKKAGKSTPPVKSAPAKAAARKTAKPAPRSAASSEVPAEMPSAPVASPAASAPDVSSVLANVALVNEVVGAVGGLDKVKQVVEAVKACGGVEAFLKHLELVAGIRRGDAR